MSKTIDFSKNIYELCKDDPQVIEIMEGLGFNEITNRATLSTVGRFMTIPKGSAMKGVAMEKIKEEFIKNGYEVKE